MEQHLLSTGRRPGASFPQGDKKKLIISIRHSCQRKRTTLGASPSPTCDHSYAWQMCELVSRVAMVESPCLRQGGPQVSVIAVFTSAVPFLLISVLNPPCYSVSSSFPVVPSVGIVRGLLPASLKDDCCHAMPLYLLFFRLKPQLIQSSLRVMLHRPFIALVILIYFPLLTRNVSFFPGLLLQ